MSYRTEISKILKEDFRIRKRKGFYKTKTQLQLAELWNVSKNTANNKLCGKSAITREELEIYARTFHEDSDWINEIQEEAIKKAKEENK